MISSIIFEEAQNVEGDIYDIYPINIIFTITIISCTCRYAFVRASCAQRVLRYTFIYREFLSEREE